MRYKAVGKEEIKRKVVEAAGQSFQIHGYAGISVDGLANAAGVTLGAFYSHFGSIKEVYLTSRWMFALMRILTG
ncbi:MAG: TetR/AcrR family transcriptional repressor of nem operon [Granulosicoccus sp.]|jgi:AcrR family transcriptional regulator